MSFPNLRTFSSIFQLWCSTVSSRSHKSISTFLPKCFSVTFQPRASAWCYLTRHLFAFCYVINRRMVFLLPVSDRSLVFQFFALVIPTNECNPALARPPYLTSVSGSNVKNFSDAQLVPANSSQSCYFWSHWRDRLDGDNPARKINFARTAFATAKCLPTCQSIRVCPLVLSSLTYCMIKFLFDARLLQPGNFTSYQECLRCLCPRFSVDCSVVHGSRALCSYTAARAWRSYPFVPFSGCLARGLCCFNELRDLEPLPTLSFLSFLE